MIWALILWRQRTEALLSLCPELRSLYSQSRGTAASCTMIA
jgi:hypothetical protein